MVEQRRTARAVSIMVRTSTFESYEDLLNGCSSSRVKSLVSSILFENRYLEWEFVSCSVAGDTCQAEFISPDETAGVVYHLYYELTESGQFGYMVLETIAPAWAQSEKEID